MSSALRIGIVTKYLGRPVGHGTYAANFIEAMRRAEPVPSVALYAPPEAAARSRAVRGAWELGLAPRQARRAGVDLVHYLYPAASLQPASLPAVVNLFDVIEWTVPGYAKSGLERRLERRLLRQAARVIVPSLRVADDVHRVLALEPDRIVLVPPGAPPVRPARGPRQPYWLFLGGTERRKNLRVVLRALADGAPDGTRLRVVGAIEGGSRFETRTDLLGPLAPEDRARVDWLGEVDEPELDRLYAETAALVYPSLEEGFGHPPLEAMARGTPVIASRVPSIAPGFEDAALIVDPDDATAVRQAMQRVLTDEALRVRLAARGAELAELYSWDETARRTIAVYHDVLR